jgi:hypothetical protein
LENIPALNSKRNALVVAEPDRREHATTQLRRSDLVERYVGGVADWIGQHERQSRQGRQVHDHTQLARRKLGAAAPLRRSRDRTAGVVIGLLSP